MKRPGVQKEGGERQRAHNFGRGLFARGEMQLGKMFGIANGAGDTDEGVDTRACSLNEEYDNAGREAADHDTQEEAGERAVLGSNGESSGADTTGHRGGEEGAAFGDVVAIGNAGGDENPSHTKKDSEHRTVNRLLNSEKVRPPRSRRARVSMMARNSSRRTHRASWGTMSVCAPSPSRDFQRVNACTQVNWLDLPDGTLIYLFDAIYVREGGRQSIENVSKVCRLWREAALEVVMRDTAGSKMKQYVSITRKHGGSRLPSSVWHSVVLNRPSRHSGRQLA